MTTMRTRLLHVRTDGTTAWRSDDLTPEEPLEIRMNGTPVSVTMRTPGADFDLAAGFLVTEGVIRSTDEIRAMRACPHAADATGSFNVIDIELTHPSPQMLARTVFTTSSCGICGKASIDAVRTASQYKVGDDPLRMTPALLAALPERLRVAQRVFSRTGGLHAAGLFDATGSLVCVREDVGRHNAFDKVIGWAGTQRMLPLRSHVMLASGRASFELTQKALMAGIPLIAAVSAPSQLAVDLARDAGMTMVGFLRGDTMNVYTGHERIVAA